MALNDADAELVARHVWAFLTSGGKTAAQDRLTGIDTGWLPNVVTKLDFLSGQVAALQAQVAALPAGSNVTLAEVLKAIGVAATAAADTPGK